MRLFAAIEIPQPVQDQIELWWQEARGHLDPDLWREVPPHLWHLTVAFYGDVSGDETDDLAEELAEYASQSSEIHLQLKNYGVFPNASKANVFWVGVQEKPDVNHLKHLTRCCRRAGHMAVHKRTAKETSFQAHITVARSKAHNQLMDMQRMQMIAALPEIDWMVGRIHLYHSILRPEGPQYRRLETFDLNTAGQRMSRKSLSPD